MSNKTYPYPFDDDERRKFIPSKMHKTIHARRAMVDIMEKHLTNIDTILYSDEMRNKLYSLISTESVKSHLLNANTTRQFVYRYHMKGGNVLFLIVEYLQKKYGVLAESTIPVLPEGDWDTSLFINPSLSDIDFNIIKEIVIPYVLKYLVELSNDIVSEDFDWHMLTAIDTATDYITGTNQTAYLEYKYTYVKKSAPVAIMNEDETYKSMLKSMLGKSGVGTYISSNSKPFDASNFYLARVLANVFAISKVNKQISARMPVEIFDFSIPYKGDHLIDMWEAYSEYHINTGSFNFRILSPVSLYIDVVKCLETNRALSRTNKISRRSNRLHKILNEMLIPYGPKNNIMRHNFTRHLRSTSRIGNIVRSIAYNSDTISHV